MCRRGSTCVFSTPCCRFCRNTAKTPSDRRMALNVGSRLGHYDVTALIGEGGMGQVYQATDTKLSRQVALIVDPPNGRLPPLPQRTDSRLGGSSLLAAVARSSEASLATRAGGG